MSPGSAQRMARNGRRAKLARINQKLLEAIAHKQDITVKGVYPQITKVVQDTFLERDLAALVLGTRHRININKYSTPAQRAAIRGHLTGGNHAQPAPAPPTPRLTIRKSGKKQVSTKTKGNSVFVVHGRDILLRKSMFDFLRSLGLNPMEWEQAVDHAKGNNPDVGDIIETAMARVQAVVVMFSPDELAHLKDQFWGPDDKDIDGKPAGQARPNVIFEAGLALGAHPEKTVIVQIGKVRPFSDIAGKHLVRLSDAVSTRNDFANRLAKIRCEVNRVGSDWMTVGQFAPTEAKPARRSRTKKL
jgi:predicted nucleotide-binding protein